MQWTRAAIASLAVLILGSPVWGQQVGPLPDIQRGDIALYLKPIATGLGAPDYAISPPGDAHRLFVVEQKGQILVVQDGALLPNPALDVQSLVAPPHNPANANDERGLLGLAFSPGFGDPQHVGFRTLYTFSGQLIPVGTSPTYPAPNSALQNYKTVVDEWKMSATDPNVVDPTSRREIISFGKNAGNHNGGTIAFGPDGYLYLGLGDGGNANDVGPSHIEPGGNAQNLSTPLGKMLRFDPVNPALTSGSADPISPNGQYRIPATNPFQGPGQVPEIYAYGLRNPYRFAFDRATGDLIVADVGQRNIEEIDRVTIGGNYGWAVKEGDFLFNRADGTIGARSPGSPAGLIDPISGPLGTLEYDHSDGISITGGFVYHGTAIPELVGKYIFGDLAIQNAPPRIDGRLFYADLDMGEIREFRLPLFLNDKLPDRLTVHGFGEDASGELYAAVTNTPPNGTGGILYGLAPVARIGFDLKPESITLNARGLPKRVHAFLEPPPPFSPSDIDVASIRLNNVIPVDLTAPVPVVIGDEDDDGIPDLKVYFSRSEVALILPADEHAPVKITGLLGASSGFEGYDEVRVGGGHVMHPAAHEVLVPGENYTVTYEGYSGAAPNVALMFSPDGGASWTLQSGPAAHRGALDWLVPGETTSDALLAVVEATEGMTGAEDVIEVVAVSHPFSIQAVLGVSDGALVTRLLPPHPNPSGGHVSLGFSIARAGEVELTVFDLQGRQVAQPAVGSREAGAHVVVWDGRWVDGRRADAGLYFVRLRADGRELRGRLVRLD